MELGHDVRSADPMAKGQVHMRQSKAFFAGALALTLTLLALNVALAADVELLANGDFETADLSGWTWTATDYADPTTAPAVGAHTITDGQGLRLNPGTDSAHSGQGSEQGGAISQTIAMTAGETYHLTGGVLVMEVVEGSANADAGRIRLYIDGDLLWDWDFGYLPVDYRLTNAFDIDYTPTTSGDHEYRLLFTRTYMSTVPAYPGPVVYHYADDLSVMGPEAAGDTEPPVVALDSPSPGILWPPNGKPVAVTIAGSVVDDTGVQAAWIEVDDEYDECNGLHDITGLLGPDGSFSLTLDLIAWRNGKDRDGRTYDVCLHATDAAGNEADPACVTVWVPHDQRSGK